MPHIGEVRGATKAKQLLDSSDATCIMIECLPQGAAVALPVQHLHRLCSDAPRGMLEEGQQVNNQAMLLNFVMKNMPIEHMWPGPFQPNSHANRRLEKLRALKCHGAIDIQCLRQACRV